MKKLLVFIILPMLMFPLLTRAEHGYTVEKDIVWASPDGFELTMDIYTPILGRIPIR